MLDRRPLGQSRLTVPSLCLGTMMYGDQIGEEEANRQMGICIDRGIDFFDTAELYTIPPKPETQGESERIVGRWLKATGNRDKVIVATKVCGRAPIPWLRDGKEIRLSPDQIRSAVERSLKNLQTDYIDLYQTHWPDRKLQLFGGLLRGYEHYDDDCIALEETLGALGDMVREGKIRQIGVSNETPWGVMKMVGLAETERFPRIHSIQNGYNLLNRTFETGLAEIALQENVGLLAYSPIAQGVLTGKYLAGNLPDGSRGAVVGRLDRYKTPSAEKATQSYVDLARKFGIDPAAFALQFVTTRPFVTSNIFGARGIEQLETALSSLDIKWTEEMEREINKVHAEIQNPCP